MKTILPAIGIVEASEPAQYLITPFQQGSVVLQAFLDDVLKRKPQYFHSMTYGTTLQSFFGHLPTFVAAGIDSKNVFDHLQGLGPAEKPKLIQLDQQGYHIKERFLLGTTPLHHAINHLKACWDSDGYVFHGSWNYSASADSQYNVIEAVHSPEVAAAYEAAFQFAWQWILANEPQYQTVTAPKGSS